MAVPFNDLDTAVRNVYLPGIVNQVFLSNALLARLKSKNKVELKGGRKIAQPVTYARLNGGSYSGLDTFDTSYVQTDTYAEWEWRPQYVDVTIPGEDLDKADSDEEVIDLLGSKMENAELTLDHLIHSQIMGDGTGNGGKDMDGLINACDDGTNYATYGGINRTIETWWKGKVDFTGGAITQDLVGSMYSQCTHGNIEPDLILMSQTLYSKWDLRLQPQQRYVSDDIAKSGFSGFKFRKADVLPDDYVASGTILVLNTSYIKFVLNKNRAYDWTEPKTPVDQHAYIRQILSMCNLICTAPWRQGRITNVT